MAAQIVEMARSDQSGEPEKLSEELARTWLHDRGDGVPDGTFDVTMRHLANSWGWSIYGVTKLLNSMEAAGTIAREVLPDNGGTRITIVRQNGLKLISLRDIACLQTPPSQSLSGRLAQAYYGIIYGEAGFEDCGVEHLELIEQALFDSSANDNRPGLSDSCDLNDRCDLKDTAEPSRQAA